MAKRYWAVRIEVDGEEILCIEANCLSGASDIDQYEEETELCLRHLASFLGFCDPERFPTIQGSDDPEIPF